MKCLHRELSSENGDFDFNARLDMYFLPGASNEDCISHYLGEKTARGSYKTQLQKVHFKECGRDEVHPLLETNAQLPGMVNRYRELGQILFICPKHDWCKSQHTLWVLRFSGGDDSLEPFYAECHPINKYNPAYDLGIFHEMYQDPVDEIMLEGFYWVKERWLRVWRKTTSRGWTG